MVIFHFQILKKKYKKIDAAHFLDARGNEKQVFNLEWPYNVAPGYSPDQREDGEAASTAVV